MKNQSEQSAAGEGRQEQAPAGVPVREMIRTDHVWPGDAHEDVAQLVLDRIGCCVFRAPGAWTRNSCHNPP